MKKWSFRACALTAALLMLAPLLMPLSAHAATPTTPLIIIPGATGTTLVKDGEAVWPNTTQMVLSKSDNFMDPLAFNSDLTPTDPTVHAGEVIGKLKYLDIIPAFDYTEGLIQTLTDAGYEKGKNLFIFPYDWRQPVTTSADQLSSFLNLVEHQTGASTFDAVAHSMGGLVLEQYITQAPMNRIDKAIFVGTPFIGAPKALKTLLFGDNLSVPVLNPAEIKKIATNMPGLYDLLPSQNYYTYLGGVIWSLSQPLSYDRTITYGVSQGLNAAAWDMAQTLHTNLENYFMAWKNVDPYLIAGCTTPTLGTLQPHRTANGSVDGWEPTFIWGDGTVPTGSALHTPLEKYHIYNSLEGDHAHLLSLPWVAKEIVHILQGQPDQMEPNISDSTTGCGLNGRLISVFSPVDISATDSTGATVGRLPDGEVRQDLTQAAYEELNGHKFLFWPDNAPLPQVKLQGTDNGTFTLSVSDVKNDAVSNTITYTDVPVNPNLQGELDLAHSSNLLLDNDGDGTVDQTLHGDTIPPEIGVTWDEASHNLKFFGEDNSGIVTVSAPNATVTATDESGNTTTLQIFRDDGKSRVRAQLTNLLYNNQPGYITPTKLDYSWASDNLTQELTTSFVNVKAVFDGKNTKITSKSGNGKGQVQTLPGLVLLKIVTHQGQVNWSY